MLAPKSLEENVMEKKGDMESVAFYMVFAGLSPFPYFVLTVKAEWRTSILGTTPFFLA